MKTVTSMSRFLTIAFLLCSFVAHNRTITTFYFSEIPSVKTGFSNASLGASVKSGSPSSLNDSLGLGLLNPTDTIHIQSIMETKNTPVTARYILKTTRRGDTIAMARNAYQAVFAIPNGQFARLDSVPQSVFPSPQDTIFNDSIYPFKIIPIKTDQRVLGLTTFDLALMSRHILGSQPFTSPYKLLAADVNKDGSVDGMDIIHLRRLILRIDSMFKHSPHWVFIPKTYTLPTVLPRLDSIPQAYFFNPYTPNLPNPFVFTTIKIGDVNNSYTDTTSMGNNLLQARNRVASFVLTTENRRIQKGLTYELRLKSAKKEKFIALQGTLSLGTEGGKNELEMNVFDQLTSETLTQFGEQNINFTARNKAVFSWHTVADKLFEENATVLTVKFTAKNDGYLSDMLKINDDFAESLAYTEGGDARRIELQFSNPSKDFEVFQNEPNPFSGETSVRLNINTNSAAIPVKCFVFDATGNALFEQVQTLTSGTHVLNFNAHEMGLSKAGLYFLKVATPVGVQTIKLVKF